MFLRRKTTVRLVAVALTATLLDGSAWGRSRRTPPGSRLAGSIRASDGKSAARGAVVEVRPLDGSSPYRSAPTDRRGRFVLEGLPYGWAEIVVTTEQGDFLGDQSVNLPPGSKVTIDLTLVARADRPASWWTDRHLEPSGEVGADQVAGLAQSSQKLTGVEYWKSPTGIAILVAAGIAVLAVIASGGGGSTAP